MKVVGINNTIKFILKKSTPILEIRNGVLEESERKLIKGTVIDGILKKRVVKHNGKKIPIKLVEIKGKKGYIFPNILNIYVEKLAKFDGAEIENKEDEVKTTSFGEKKTTKSKAKDMLINYGIPIIGGFVGYKIAKKMDLEPKKMIGMVIFFSLIGLLPRYLYKK